MADHVHTVPLKGSKVAILDGNLFHCTIRGGRTTIYNNLVLYGSDGKPMGVNYGKFWLDAEHAVAGLKLL